MEFFEFATIRAGLVPMIGLTNRRVSPRTISWYLRPLGISLTRLITMSVWLIPLTDSTASLCRSWLRQVSLYNAANCETKMMSYYIWNWTSHGIQQNDKQLRYDQYKLNIYSVLFNFIIIYSQMRVTIAILLTLSALALGKIERMRMPRGLCSLYTDVGKQYKKPGNTKTQQEVQSLALRQYLWSSSSSTIKIPDATVKWLESLDREIYNLASQQGRKKRQATWYRGQRKEIRKLNEMERNQVFDCLKQLKATTVSIQFLKTLNHVA